MFELWLYETLLIFAQIRVKWCCCVNCWWIYA